MKVCRECKSEVVACREAAGRPGFYECPYGHGPWAADDPGWP